MDKFEAHVKDMEAAAIGYVATQAKVPWFCLKSVTDIVDGGMRPSQTVCICTRFCGVVYVYIVSGVNTDLQT